MTTCLLGGSLATMSVANTDHHPQQPHGRNPSHAPGSTSLGDRRHARLPADVAENIAAAASTRWQRCAVSRAAKMNVGKER